jgi:hypothetical protein
MNNNAEISHFELCEKTAQWALKKAKVVLYEYQSFASYEFPDVLCFKDSTTLYEIKVDHADFIRDRNKECRIKYTMKYFGRFNFVKDKIKKACFDWPELKELVQQFPHLGRHRYYVCLKGLIKPEEITNGFGLYYYSEGRFRKVKESKTFRNDIHTEMSLLTHAFRKHASGDGSNILINTYGQKEHQQ